MISAGHDKWFAQFQGEGEGTAADDDWEEVGGVVHTPVIAWDDEGYALVVSGEAGRLVRACEVAGFVTMCDAAEKTELEMTPEELAERAREERAKREKRR